MKNKEIFADIINKIKEGKKISEIKEEYVKCERGEPAEFYCVETEDRGLIPDDLFLESLELKEDEGYDCKTVPCYKRTSFVTNLTPTEGKVLEEFLIKINEFINN